MREQREREWEGRKRGREVDTRGFWQQPVLPRAIQNDVGLSLFFSPHKGSLAASMGLVPLRALVPLLHWFAHPQLVSVLGQRASPFLYCPLPRVPKSDLHAWPMDLFRNCIWEGFACLGSWFCKLKQFKFIKRIRSLLTMCCDRAKNWLDYVPPTAWNFQSYCLFYAKPGYRSSLFI